MKTVKDFLYGDKMVSWVCQGRCLGEAMNKLCVVLVRARVFKKKRKNGRGYLGL